MSEDTMSREFHEAQIAKIYVEIEKMRAETAKVSKENKYFVLSMLLSSAVIGATIALGSVVLTKLFLQ